MFKSLPMLYGVARTGKVKQWQAAVQGNDDGTATIIIKSGYVGQKITERPKVVRKGKNIGKSNETTPFEQAVSQIESAWSKKRDQNYELEQMDPNNYTPRLMLPQLAKGNKKGKIVWPAYIQPKLNGVCNLAEQQPNPLINDITVLHHSRGGHLFETLAHLDPWIKMLGAPGPTHGELYVHGWSLQKIGSYTKKLKEDQHLLEYWLYDIANLYMPFTDRIQWLEEQIYKLHSRGNSPIRFTPTSIVNN